MTAGEALKLTQASINYPPVRYLWPSTTDNCTNGTTGIITVVPSTAITGGDTWYIQTATNGTITPIGTDNVWGEWNQAYVQAAEAHLWNTWIEQGNARIEVRETRAQAEARRLVEEQVMREYRAAEELRRKTTEEADRRAKKLLIENISPAQRRSLTEKGYFDVPVKGKTYRIRWGSHGNVSLVHRAGTREEQEAVSYCIQPPGVPAGDAMLAQKLMLETDEASFLRIANARQLVPGA